MKRAKKFIIAGGITLGILTLLSLYTTWDLKRIEKLTEEGYSEAD